jgi:rare lipoprotein A
MNASSNWLRNRLLLALPFRNLKRFTSETAAHRSLPFGSRVRVTNRSNGRSVIVTINDRGPFVRSRIIDVTPAAAHALGMSGLAPVTVERE